MDTSGFLKVKNERDTGDMAVNPVEQEISNDQMEKKRRERKGEFERPKEKNGRMEEEDERVEEEDARTAEEDDGADENDEQEEQAISMLATGSNASSSPLSSALFSPAALISERKAVGNENEGSRKTKKVQFSM